jgi:hypothetical protein
VAAAAAKAEGSASDPNGRSHANDIALLVKWAENLHQLADFVFCKQLYERLY